MEQVGEGAIAGQENQSMNVYLEHAARMRKNNSGYYEINDVGIEIVRQ